MTNLPTFVHLTSQDNSIVFSTANRLPEVIYWGSRLSKDINPEHLILLRTRQEAKCAVVEEPPISLSPNQGQGFTGMSAIEDHREIFDIPNVFKQFHEPRSRHSSETSVETRCRWERLRFI